MYSMCVLFINGGKRAQGENPSCLEHKVWRKRYTLSGSVLFNWLGLFCVWLNRTVDTVVLSCKRYAKTFRESHADMIFFDADYSFFFFFCLILLRLRLLFIFFVRSLLVCHSMCYRVTAPLNCAEARQPASLFKRVICLCCNGCSKIERENVKDEVLNCSTAHINCLWRLPSSRGLRD